MPKVNIDLAQENDFGPVEIKRDDVHYPTFHVETDKEIPFPHEGEMTIKFKKVSSSMSEREDGKTRYSCSIEVQKITELYPEKSDEDREPKTEEALDKLAKMVSEARKAGKSSY